MRLGSSHLPKLVARFDAKLAGYAPSQTADLHQRDEYAYERADLWTVTLDGQPQRITQDDGWQHLSPAWSPDGKSIAVLREEGLRRILNAKLTHGSPVDVYLFPADGHGTPADLDREAVGGKRGDGSGHLQRLFGDADMGLRSAHGGARRPLWRVQLPRRPR